MRRDLLGIAMGVALATGAAGCQQLGFGQEKDEFPLATSRDIPGAKGEVKVYRGEGGNQVVEIEVERLAPPNTVVPDATAYVVWLKPEGEEKGPAVNLGVMRMSGDQKGKFKGTTPFRRFELWVTAEPDPQITEPSRERLMRAQVQPTGRGTF